MYIKSPAFRPQARRVQAIFLNHQNTRYMEHQISYDMLFPTVNTLNNDFPDVDIQRRLVNEEVCYFMIIPDQYTSQQLIMLGMLLGKAYMKLWTIEQIQELPC